ncbi:MAG: hypothetical protein HY553_01315 [Elusimicrobia bacterium]|nr:hypothetical protein [Elusimicrobiota bacterium]
MARPRGFQLEQLASRYRTRARNVRLYIEELELAKPTAPAAPWGPGVQIRSSRRGLWAAALVLVCASGWGVRAWRTGTAAVTAFNAPLVRPLGLAFGGDELVAYDAARGLLVHLEPNGRGVRSSEPVDSPSVGALAWTGTELWTADSKTGTIRRHGTRHGRPAEAVFHEPYQRPRALATGRDVLWVLDAASRCINEYDRTRGLRLRRRYPLEGFIAAGLAVDGTSFWVVDEPGRVLRRYVAAEDESWMLRGEWSLDALLPRHGPAAGLAFDGRHLWLLTAEPSGLYRIRASALGR